MKVVILAGGFGSRLSEYTEAVPKPMVKIGNKPILFHLMKYYYKFGFKEFIIALGYKSEIIKDYFLNYDTTGGFWELHPLKQLKHNCYHLEPSLQVFFL